MEDTRSEDGVVPTTAMLLDTEPQSTYTVPLPARASPPPPNVPPSADARRGQSAALVPLAKLWWRQ